MFPDYWTHRDRRFIATGGLIDYHWSPSEGKTVSYRSVVVWWGYTVNRPCFVFIPIQYLEDNPAIEQLSVRQ